MIGFFDLPFEVREAILNELFYTSNNGFHVYLDPIDQCSHSAAWKWKTRLTKVHRDGDLVIIAPLQAVPCSVTTWETPDNPEQPVIRGLRRPGIFYTSAQVRNEALSALYRHHTVYVHYMLDLDPQISYRIMSRSWPDKEADERLFAWLGQRMPLTGRIAEAQNETEASNPVETTKTTDIPTLGQALRHITLDCPDNYNTANDEMHISAIACDTYELPRYSRRDIYESKQEVTLERLAIACPRLRSIALKVDLFQVVSLPSHYFCARMDRVIKNQFAQLETLRVQAALFHGGDISADDTRFTGLGWVFEPKWVWVSNDKSFWFTCEDDWTQYNAHVDAARGQFADRNSERDMQYPYERSYFLYKPYHSCLRKVFPTMSTEELNLCLEDTMRGAFRQKFGRVSNYLRRPEDDFWR